MTKHLYDIFKHWYHGGTIYIYSDPHFSDLESYKLRFPNELGKYASKLDFVAAKDQIQIDNINKRCGKNDTLIILGDVGNTECVKRLKAGYKVLIMGNHDAGASNYKRTYQHTEYYRNDEIKYGEDNHLFDEVYEGTLQISPKIILSHEPVEYRHCLNIHGHVHNVNPLGAYTEGINCTSHYNCCAEQINYTPVALKDIVESGILKSVLDVHRVTIDTATKRKQKRLKKVIDTEHK